MDRSLPHENIPALFEDSNKCYSPENNALYQHENIPALFEDSNWQACFVSFITGMKSPRTQAFYANILYRFLKNRDPSAISRADVEAFTSGDLASSTIITRVTAIRSFYRYASAYMVSGKNGRQKPLFKDPNPCNNVQHRNQPGNGPKARLTIPTGSRLPPQVTIGHEEATSGPTSDTLVQQRRYYLELILHDFLGDRPATALAPYLAGNPLIVGSGPFLFASNKCMPHPLGQESLKRLIAYVEHIGNNEHVWCSAYWRIADKLSRQKP